MNKNAKKSLLTLLTTAILFIPNSERGGITNKDVTFKFYDSEKMIEILKKGCFGDDEYGILENNIKSISNFPGVFYLKKNVSEENEIVYLFKKLTLREKEVIKVTYTNIESRNRHIIEHTSISDEYNKYKKTIEITQLFEGSIDDIITSTTTIEDKQNNELTISSRDYFLSNEDIITIQLSEEYGSHHFKMQKKIVSQNIKSYQLYTSFLGDIEIDEEQYDALEDYITQNKWNNNYSSLFNNIYDFINSISHQKQKTI